MTHPRQLAPPNPAVAARSVAARIPVGRMPWSIAVAPREGGRSAETIVGDLTGIEEP